MSFLRALVTNKIREFPTAGEASEFFGVSEEALQSWTLDSGCIPVSAAEKVFSPEAIANLSRAPVSKQVCMMLPWYKSTNPATSFSVTSLLDRTKMAVMLHYGDAFVVHSRNKLADRFLGTGIEWAFTVDDDMVVPCGNAKWYNDLTGFNLPDKFAGMNAIERLLSHQKTLVGGLYFGRWRYGKPVYAEGTVVNSAEEKWVRRAPYDTVKPTKWVGTGCLLIHRSVFLDIEKCFPHLARTGESGGNWFTSSEHELKKSVDEALSVLDDEGISESARIRQVKSSLAESKVRSARNSALGMGEDVQFCIRATQAGHQPHVDLGLLCGHIGTFVFGPRKVGWER